MEGAAEAAQAGALDPQAIEQYLDGIVKMVGRIDVSFNAMRLFFMVETLLQSACQSFV